EEALLDPTFVDQMPIVEGSVSALRKLHKHVHIVVATSRPLTTQLNTYKWLKRNFCFHEVANTREIGKAVLGLEILIDDNIENMRSFVSSSGLGILFDQPWNREAESEQQLSQF